jgi:hypothetical protein
MGTYHSSLAQKLLAILSLDEELVHGAVELRLLLPVAPRKGKRGFRDDYHDKIG